VSPRRHPDRNEKDDPRRRFRSRRSRRERYYYGPKVYPIPWRWIAKSAEENIQKCVYKQSPQILRSLRSLGLVSRCLNKLTEMGILMRIELLSDEFKKERS